MLRRLWRGGSLGLRGADPCLGWEPGALWMCWCMQGVQNLVIYVAHGYQYGGYEEFHDLQC